MHIDILIMFCPRAFEYTSFVYKNKKTEFQK